MKKLSSILSILLLIAIFSVETTAQQTWEWDAYQVKLDLPDDFKVTKNTDNEFEASGEGMEILMYIFEADISLSDMREATIEAANEMELEEWDAVQNVRTRGFEGKYVAGYLDEAAVLLCGLINPENTTNFFVAIVFDDEDEVAEEDAFDILNSIRK